MHVFGTKPNSRLLGEWRRVMFFCGNLRIFVFPKAGIMNLQSFEPFYSHQHQVYNLEGFSPAPVNEEYLRALGVRVVPSAETLEGLRRGDRKSVV